MSEWFDLCRGLRRIARHNSRCENGWLISFYSWHRGLSVWLCAHSAQLGAHTGYWQWPASARPGDTELILARGQAAHTRATRHPRDTRGQRAGRASVREWPGPGWGQLCSFSGRLEPGRAPGGQAGTDRFIACQTAALQAAGPGWPGQTLVSLNHPQPRPDQLQSLRISAANTPGISAATLHTGATCHPSIVIDTHPRS